MRWAVFVVLVGVVWGQCPEFKPQPMPTCIHRTDHELCLLAAHQEPDRLADFEFMDINDILHADPLACKLRTAAIRQHVLYNGRMGFGSEDCKRAAAVFETNVVGSTSMADICERIGFPSCSPTCHNGGSPHVSENGTCSCKCPKGWSGRDCSKCDMMAASCLHEGTLVTSETECECKCKYPWTGVHCEICNRNCLHGSCNPTDAHCKCQCHWPWSGIECSQCDLECFHGGKLLSGNACECRCNPLAQGPQCETCTARCLNGGILDKDTCTCKCIGGFLGHQCEICNITCHHNSTFDPNTCSCKCTNPWTAGEQCEICRNDCHGRGRETECNCVDCSGYWTGQSCNNCTLRCVNEGELDSHSCKCACDRDRCRHGTPRDDCSCECEGFWRGEMCNECHLNCVHGTLDRKTCSCACDGAFTGVKCDQCTKNCSGRGVLDASKCQCTSCISPYHGFDCSARCPLNCQHGSFLNAEKCVCEKCPLPWLGKECDSCRLLLNHTRANVCGVFGTFDEENCLCVCQEGWSGERCNRCSRECAHGTLNPLDCSCTCDRHWRGVNCTDCSLTCQNGGVLDSKNCYCECDQMHSGSQCQGGPCYMQQACDSCLSVSDGCQWCGKTASCDKLPGPGATSSCNTGPVKSGQCPLYSECHLCDYTSAELEWLAVNGNKVDACDDKVVMPERDNKDLHAGDEAVICDASKQETWCEPKRICVQDWLGGENGPCRSVMAAPVAPRHSHNGFIASNTENDFKN